MIRRVKDHRDLGLGGLSFKRVVVSSPNGVNTLQTVCQREHFGTESVFVIKVESSSPNGLAAFVGIQSSVKGVLPLRTPDMKIEIDIRFVPCQKNHHLPGGHIYRSH